MKIFLKRSSIVIAPFLISILFCQCREKRESIEDNSIPRITHVTKNEVTICWDSPEKYEGVVYYKNTEKLRGRPTSGKDTHESLHHTVVINDLSPSTIYSYWLKDAKAKYTFRTKPENNSPLSFLITAGDTLKNYVSLITTENCGFILSLNDKKADNYKISNSFVPIYYMNGTNAEMSEDPFPQNSWSLDWGDLRLFVINNVKAFGSFSNTYGTHLLGIILNSGLISDNIKELKKSEFHHNILSQNKSNSNSPVVFVGIINYPRESFILDGVSYFSIPARPNYTDSIHGSSVVLLMNGQSISAYFPSKDKEITLRIPPLHGSRTCFECQRLAKKGQFEKSISAYKKFIETYQKQYQIDNAYFDIAKIFDYKLFQFSEAKKWYKYLNDSFPDGIYSSIAKQRLHYFAKYSDCNLEPLEKFERIKSKFSEFSDISQKQQKQKIILTPKQNELFNKAAEINKNFPDCKTYSLILSWLADQYQQIDGKKAVIYYKTLIEKFPEYSATNEIQFKLAETYFNIGEFRKAKKTFTEIKNQLPRLSEKIDSQLIRVNTKLRRSNIANLSMFLLIVILLFAILLRPFGLKLPRLKIMLFIILGFLYSFLMFFIAIREEITENFNGSYKEFILFTIFFIVALIMSMIVARSYSVKLNFQKSLYAKLLGGFISILFFISAFYLILYHIYEQYLSYLT
jgi:tetratricopeptide (TPR) repeat protein